jgi:hypothetical protein
VVAGDEHERLVQRVGQVFQVVERQVARGEHQVHVGVLEHLVGPQLFDDLVRDHQNPSHSSSVIRSFTT